MFYLFVFCLFVCLFVVVVIVVTVVKVLLFSTHSCFNWYRKHCNLWSDVSIVYWSISSSTVGTHCHWWHFCRTSVWLRSWREIVVNCVWLLAIMNTGNVIDNRTIIIHLFRLHQMRCCYYVESCPPPKWSRSRRGGWGWVLKHFGLRISMDLEMLVAI